MEKKNEEKKDIHLIHSKKEDVHTFCIMGHKFLFRVPHEWSNKFGEVTVICRPPVRLTWCHSSARKPGGSRKLCTQSYTKRRINIKHPATTV
jgi:hypothetical protein